MATQHISRTRIESPERWHKAAERARAEGIQIRQLQGSGQWVATSGSARDVGYEVKVSGNVAHGCDCLAGMNADPVCKHRAAYYLLIGALWFPEPEPDPPAACWACNGQGAVCPVCGGVGWAVIAGLAA